MLIFNPFCFHQHSRFYLHFMILFLFYILGQAKRKALRRASTAKPPAPSAPPVPPPKCWEAASRLAGSAAAARGRRGLPLAQVRHGEGVFELF